MTAKPTAANRESESMEENIQFLKRLTAEPGISGYEENAQRVWREYVEPFADSIQEHPHGDLTARLEGELDDAVMLIGHIDEIGMIVKHVEGNGFLKAAAVGGMRGSLLQSQRVQIVGRNGVVEGVVGAFADEKGGPSIEELFIDIGAKDRDAALERVEPGDPIVVGVGWLDLGGGMAAARNFDNRIGCYIVAETMRRLRRNGTPRATVLAVSAVQEETGGPGAGQAAHDLNPAEAIAFDVTWATDYPSTSASKRGDVKLGAGPVLIRGVRTSQRIYERLRATAEAHEIPRQIETETGRTYTDADAASIQRGGIPVSVVSVPCRYMHSSNEVINLNDVEQIVQLTTAYLSEYDPAR